jgi:integrase
MAKNLTVDARTGLYRRDLGWKVGRNGGYTQHRFYLGRDKHQAQIACARLEALWAGVETRWEKSEGHGERPLWDATTLAMAKGIIEGEKEVPVRPPEIVRGKNKALDAELLGIWFAKLVRDFPGVNLTLDDEQLQEDIATVRAAFEKKAERLKPASKSRQTLHEALDAYKAWLHGRHLTRPETGKKQRTSQTGVKQGERVERLKQHVQNMPLSEFGLKQIEDVAAYWANRPLSSRSEPFSPITCKHHIRLWKHFVLWLHKEPEFDWKRPGDLEWDRVSIPVHPHEVAAKATAEQVETYTKDELKTLWEYGTDLHRTLMALALNCGFGIAEIGTLTEKEVQGEYIKRIRWKSKVYGEWKLWPITLELLAKLKPNDTPWLLVTGKGKQLIEPTESNYRGPYIPNRWNYLTQRIRKDHPGFRQLSFNKLRKTAGNLIRGFSDGEIAGVFLCHGQAVKTDDLADVYTNRPFGKVFEAQDRVWEFLKDIFSGQPVEECKTSVGTVKKIRALHEQGLPVKQIAELCSVGVSTVRRRIKE